MNAVTLHWINTNELLNSVQHRWDAHLTHYHDQQLCRTLSCWILSWTRLTSITGICTGSPGVELRSRCSETKFLYLSSMPGVLHSPRWLKTYKLQLHHDSLVNNCRLVAGPCNYITLRTAPRSIHQRHNHTQNRCAGNCACAAAATIAAPI